MTHKEKYHDIDQSKVSETAKARLKSIEPILFSDGKSDKYDEEEKEKAGKVMDKLYHSISENYPESLISKRPKVEHKAAPKKAAKKVSKPAPKVEHKTEAKKEAGKKTRRGEISLLAKKIRKDGERFQDAMKRAGQMIQAEKQKAKKTATKQYKKLAAFLEKNPHLSKTKVSHGVKPNLTKRPLDVERDAPRKALPAGKRISKGGDVYYEYRANRTDSNRKRYPYLALGGKLHGAGMFDHGGMYAEGGKVGDRFSMSKTISDGGQPVEMVIAENVGVKEFDKLFSDKGYRKVYDKSIVGFYFVKPNGDTVQLIPSFHRKGEIIKYAKGGQMHDYTKNLGMVKVMFSNPKYNYETNVSGDITESEARKYFVGQMFDVGVYPNENMQRCIDIEFHAKGTYAKGGKIGFKALSNKVAAHYKGKGVPAKYQSEYGKRYDAAEAHEVGDKVAAKVYRAQQAKKMAEGGISDDNVKMFDTLKKGDTIKITFKNAISGTGEATLRVKSKTVVNKGKASQAEKVNFVDTENPYGVGYYAYKRSNGQVYFAWGDMGIWGVKVIERYEGGGYMAEGGKINNFTDYYLVVNLDERGDYSADVRNPLDETVYSIDTAEQMNELIEDGFLRYKADEDLDRLTKYLMSLNIIPTGSQIYSEEEFDEDIRPQYEDEKSGHMAEGGEVPMYKIREGYDHFNDRPLYNVESTAENPNEYVGEYHDNIEDARKELDILISSTNETRQDNYMAKGGKSNSIKEKAKKLLENSIKYRWVNTDMGSGYHFYLESPEKNALGGETIDDDLVLDIYDYDEEEYPFKEWKSDLLDSGFRDFLDKMTEQYLDLYIEYLQKDDDSSFAKGGETWEEKQNKTLYNIYLRGADNKVIDVAQALYENATHEMMWDFFKRRGHDRVKGMWLEYHNAEEIKPKFQYVWETFGRRGVNFNVKDLHELPKNIVVNTENNVYIRKNTIDGYKWIPIRYYNDTEIVQLSDEEIKERNLKKRQLFYWEKDTFNDGGMFAKGGELNNLMPHSTIHRTNEK